MVAKKKIKVKEMKSKFKIIEQKKKDESDLEIEMDGSLTEDQIRMILAHRARLKAMQQGSGGIDTGLKQEVSELERKAEEAPVAAAETGRIGEQGNAVKYTDTGKGGAGSSYDMKKGYSDSGRYNELNDTEENKKSRENREGKDRNPFSNERDSRDSYDVSSTDPDKDRKRRQMW